MRYRVGQEVEFRATIANVLNSRVPRKKVYARLATDLIRTIAPVQIIDPVSTEQ